jgi:mannose-1-phosphate guanylyltransferase/mannose-6-phosphate isomerase
MTETTQAQFTQLTEHRPWGSFTILADESDHKVKRIVVLPGQRLSLQRHQKRREHWLIISGEAIVTRDDELITCGPGQSVDISQRQVHRVQNEGSEDVVFIEVQLGTYFGEDDIERLEDDYGRE